MSRQPLSELPLTLFLPSLFPPSPSASSSWPTTPHPGAYKPKLPPTPSRHPTHLHQKGLKRAHSAEGDGKEGKGTPAKKRHLEEEAVGRRLFEGLTPVKTGEGARTPTRKSEKGKLAPSPEIVGRSMPPPPAYGSHSAPTTAKPKPTNTSLSLPSSTAHARTAPTPSEEDKENHPPRPRRPLLGASKALSSTPKRSTPDVKGKGRAAGMGLGKLGVGKPATPREIGREMLLREVEEPEEVDEEMF
ncbi:hypothetical protein CALCODRAFT_557839 [Calocera cornea HHB12733]|uniref:Uncharacterized protein n=1 Tax=Calocera cornea HHB12733 TaxID=1353952 RepID=A0A165DI98_9BASI|nr:hypothetical protein CALCODRAFT_557839 [Calocera cornea HHB12733]